MVVIRSTFRIAVSMTLTPVSTCSLRVPLTGNRFLCRPPSRRAWLVLARPRIAVYEDAGSVRISVTRIGNLNEIASCFYATVDGTATAQRDYAPVLGTLRFAAGEASKTIPIPITNSGDIRGSRSFKMVLSDNEGNATFIC